MDATQYKVFCAMLSSGQLCVFTAASAQDLFWINAAFMELHQVPNPSNPREAMISPIFTLVTQYARFERNAAITRFDSSHILTIYQAGGTMEQSYKMAMEDIAQKMSPILSPQSPVGAATLNSVKKEIKRKQ